MKIPSMTTEQAEAVSRFCESIQAACPWLNICPKPEPSSPIDAIFGKNPFEE